MSFTSAEFIGFLLLTLAAYYLLPRRFQWIVLLVASYGFYLCGGVGKQLIVALVTVANFGLLYVVKYWDFTANAVASFSGSRLQLPRLDLLMPLGLSFYMFQSIGYVIDCYRGKYPPQRNVAKFALFTSFFPQMIQGPISRYGQLGNQLTAQHPFDADNLKYGIQLAMWGYLKKLVIADRAAVAVNTVFDNPSGYGGAMTALAVGFYCIQLYCDFSGGIDIWAFTWRKISAVPFLPPA